MVKIGFAELKKSPSIIEEVRWDVTPRIFFEPSSGPRDSTGKPMDTSYGYMLYVDMIQDQPALVIMQLKRIMSRTVGYVLDIPDDMLREAMYCEASECIQGMYPLSDRLRKWLRKEFGLS